MTVQDGTPRLPRLPLNTTYFTDIVEGYERVVLK